MFNDKLNLLVFFIAHRQTHLNQVLLLHKLGRFELIITFNVIFIYQILIMSVQIIYNCEQGVVI